MPITRRTATAGESPTVVIEEITPELAEKWLQQNTHNRNLIQRRVEQLARDMKAGRWELNGSTISFDKNGILLDGQHRLAAVVLSGRTIQSAVTYGLAPQSQKTMDVGAKRQFKDMLHLDGESDSVGLAAVVRMHWRLENTDITARTLTPTAGELFAHLKKHPDLREASREAGAIRHAVKAPQSVMGTFVYVALSLDTDDADYFIEKLKTGEALESTSPILRLREYLLQTSRKRERPRVEIVLAHVFKAWNLYRDGVQTQVLSFKSGGKSPEPFPVPR